MSAKAIYESKAKELLYKSLASTSSGPNLHKQPFIIIDEKSRTSVDPLMQPWIVNSKLVAKPDQLIKRRGKLGLVYAGHNWDETSKWIDQKLGFEFQVGNSCGKLKRFLLEPFVEHSPAEELYVCMLSQREGDLILFYHEGGVDVGDVDSKASKYLVDIDSEPTLADIETNLLSHAPAQSKTLLANFVLDLYKDVYQKLHFTYLEINPLVLKKDGIYVLDVAARVDQTASFMVGKLWGDIEYPSPFGRDLIDEEEYIAKLDANSGGSSLKLTVINRNGRIWTMVAGGGASVIYADTICDLGFSNELCNYGEYSGAPTEQQTFDYARTILSLMTEGTPRPDGKVFIIGGGIANFTNVASTFKGIIRALKQFRAKLIEHKVCIFVRRAGPNYQEGLRMMRELGETLGVPLHVFGPETHMTAIVAMALGTRDIPRHPPAAVSATANFLLFGASNTPSTRRDSKDTQLHSIPEENRRSASFGQGAKPAGAVGGATKPLFTSTTKAIVWGMQTRAVQGMLDFDYVCRRKEPSVVAMTYPMIGDHKQKFYWGLTDILVPVYKNMDECLHKHKDAEVVVNFASLRSAYDTTMEIIKSHPQIRVIAIIAEGIPECLTRKMNKFAHSKGVTIIGPATVGGIKPGCFKVGNTGGMMDNVLSAKLYRPGSVAYVSRSGGMSNELNNIVNINTDGVYEGIAIGGDRYPSTTFIDHIMRYEEDPNVKMIVLLGEVGGVEEYRVAEAVTSGLITKPIVAWCTGTCAKYFASDVQFGHAGAFANAERETAESKNAAMRAAGIHVPESFDSLGEKIKEVYHELRKAGIIQEREEVPPPTVPMDYDWARELGLIRKPASFMTSIVDERGHEVLYAGMPISDVIAQDYGIGGVLSLLWFQRRLPRYCCKFFEICLMATADHGPAVSGAHNTIVCARAGKDLVSCLASGLLTIGDRFGGALDGAAKQFTAAFDKSQSPADFVAAMRKEGQLIMGIGHRVKSINNPDGRVEIIKKYAREHFPSTPLLNFALEVEKITTAKKPNLIINIDGAIGVVMVDMLRGCEAFTKEEVQSYIENGVLNALFVLGRSMGFIGHFLDQRRLKQGLYRHSWDDIAYVVPEQYAGGAGGGGGEEFAGGN